MQRPRWSLRRARVLVGTKFLLIAGLLGFVVITWLVQLVAGLDKPIHVGAWLAALLAGVPAVLWLGFFYLMDRHEPEPKRLVAGVSILGALIAGPLADFVQYQVVPPYALEMQSVGAFALDRMLYAMFVQGLSQELCKYAVVRYTVYTSREFDEPMDGIVYMMACGTGFAVWTNYHQLSAQGHSVHLAAGVAKAVVMTLAHASFAGALGYVLGRAKFSRRSAPIRGLMLFGGLVIAAVLNGQFASVEASVIPAGMTVEPWRGIGVAAGFAAAVYLAIWLASRQLLARSPVRPSP